MHSLFMCCRLLGGATATVTVTATATTISKLEYCCSPPELRGGGDGEAAGGGEGSRV